MTAQSINELQAAFALSNLIVSLVILWFCICRLNSSASKRFKSIRLKFTIIMSVAILSGFQPILLATIPNLVTLLYSLGICLYLFINRSNRRG